MADDNAVVKCELATQKGLKPGDAAEADEWCFSKRRDGDGFCVGNYTNETCAIDIECDVGLYCNKTTKKCVAAAEEGFSCAHGQLCQPYLTCYEGSCTKYGALHIGEKVGVSGNAKNCITRYMDSGTRKCEHGPMLASPIFIENPRLLCNYTYNGKIIVGYPMCGFAVNGSMICPEEEGDLESYWQMLLNYTHLKPLCHVQHAFGFCDRGQTVGCSDYLDAVEGFYKMDSTTHTLLLDVPLCIRNWMYKQYWYPQCGHKSLGVKSAAGIFGLFLALVLVIL